MRIRNYVLASIGIGIFLFGAWFVYMLNGMGSWKVGMTELHLPSGKMVYLRRQIYGRGPEELYLSASDDYCAPYDRWHDYKLPAFIHGEPQTPLLVSYSGDTIIVHASKKPRSPWFFAPKFFKVEFKYVSPSDYSAYTARSANALPDGWQRIEVAFGHNTCAL